MAQKRGRRDLLGPDSRPKIDAQLQMISNGRDAVNATRAEYCSSIRVKDKSLLKSQAQRTDEDANNVRSIALRKALRGSQKQLSSRIVASVFIHTAPARKETALPGARKTASREGLQTAEVPMSELPGLGRNPVVRHIELAESLQDPTPLPSTESPVAPRPRVFAHEGVHRNGAGVLIGVIDVGGFDFSHPDFLESAKETRWVAIWDQGGSHRKGPSPFGYGAEIPGAAMNAALRQARSAGVRPIDLEPQSQMVMGSHGTHVASIAAGNSGICRKAKIAGVLISLPPEKDRREFILDSTRLAHAVDYLVALAKKERCKAVAINISLGTNGGAHDGTSGISRWIDGVLGEAGRCITIAAGNSGQEAAQHAEDMGWMMGRIHSSGKVEARGLTTDIEWAVFGNSIADVSENELQIWYSPQDRFSVRVRPPQGEWLKPVQARERIENQQLVPSKAFVSVYNKLYHPLNGANCISVYLSPYLGTDGILGVPAGIWTVRLEGVEVKDGRFRAWIERDDPRPIRFWGDKEGWNLPSCFTERSNVDQCSISTLACTRYAIAVANVDQGRSRIHISSSQGPTRDDRQKPDIAAPGTDIVAANGFAGPRDPWIGMTGTSMASPYVCGIAGLMLACNPDLTSAQVQGMMLRTASPLPGDSHRWNDRAGFGQIDPDGCIDEAIAARDFHDRTRA